MRKFSISVVFVSLSLVVLVGMAFAQDFSGAKEHAEKAFAKPNYSPYANRAFPTKVYWGDTHLHTVLSVDAGAFGNRLGLDEAYRFARGEEVVSATGQGVKLSRPLDFLVIADHSDGYGLFNKIINGDPYITSNETGRRWYKMFNAGGQDAHRNNNKTPNHLPVCLFCHDVPSCGYLSSPRVKKRRSAGSCVSARSFLGLPVAVIVRLETSRNTELLPMVKMLSSS